MIIVGRQTNSSEATTDTKQSRYHSIYCIGTLAPANIRLISPPFEAQCNDEELASAIGHLRK